MSKEYEDIQHITEDELIEGINNTLRKYGVTYGELKGLMALEPRGCAHCAFDGLAGQDTLVFMWSLVPFVDESKLV